MVEPRSLHMLLRSCSIELYPHPVKKCIFILYILFYIVGLICFAETRSLRVALADLAVAM